MGFVFIGSSRIESSLSKQPIEQYMPVLRVDELRHISTGIVQLLQLNSEAYDQPPTSDSREGKRVRQWCGAKVHAGGKQSLRLEEIGGCGQLIGGTNILNACVHVSLSRGLIDSRDTYACLGSETAPSSQQQQQPQAPRLTN